MVSGLEQLYFAAGGIGFLYVIGSALLGQFGHGHGDGGHGAHAHGAHGHAHGPAHQGHITGGHSSTLSHGGANGAHGTAHGHGPSHSHGPATHGSGSTHGAQSHTGSHHGHAANAHGAQSHTGSHHGHGHDGHGDSGHDGGADAENAGTRAAPRSELATTIVKSAVTKQDKSSVAFFTMMRFLNPMRLALICFVFGIVGITILRAMPMLGAISLAPALLVGYFSSNIFLSLLGSVMSKLEKTDSYRKEDAIGTVGQLTVPIISGGTGEITFVSKGGKSAAPARAMQQGIDISKLSKVIISDIRDGVYYVEEWDDENHIVITRPQREEA